MLFLLRLAARTVRVAAEATALALAGVVGAFDAIRAAQAQLARLDAREEDAASRILEGTDPETRTLLFSAAAVAHQDAIGRGYLPPEHPTWSQLSPAQQWLLSEQAARVELGQPLSAVGWSEERRQGFELAVRQVLSRYAAGRAGAAAN